MARKSSILKSGLTILAVPNHAMVDCRHQKAFLAVEKEERCKFETREMCAAGPIFENVGQPAP
jgi:hypothetical protein